MLSWNLRHPILACLGGFTLLIGAVLIVYQSIKAPEEGKNPILNVSFFPDDVSVIKVVIRVPDTGTIDDTEQFINEIGQRLKARGPGSIESVSGIVGISVDSSYRPVFGERRGFIFAALPKISERSFDDPRQLIQDIREELETLYSDSLAELEVEANQDGPPIGMPIAIRVQGVDDASVLAAADELYDWMSQEQLSGGLPGGRDQPGPQWS